MVGGCQPPRPIAIAPAGGFQVFINSPSTSSEQANITTSPWVTLTFTKGPNTAKMAVSNNPLVDDASIERYQPSKQWHLCATPYKQSAPPAICLPGTYTVYARFYTEALIKSPIVSAFITYAPTQGATSSFPDNGTLEQSETPEPDPQIEELKRRVRELQLTLIELAQQLIAALQDRVVEMRMGRGD